MGRERQRASSGYRGDQGAIRDAPEVNLGRGCNRGGRSREHLTVRREGQRANAATAESAALRKRSDQPAGRRLEQPRLSIGVAERQGAAIWREGDDIRDAALRSLPRDGGGTLSQRMPGDGYGTERKQYRDPCPCDESEKRRFHGRNSCGFYEVSNS